MHTEEGVLVFRQSSPSVVQQLFDDPPGMNSQKGGQCGGVFEAGTSQLHYLDNESACSAPCFFRRFQALKTLR